MTTYNPSEILRTRSATICQRLAGSEESLMLFAGKLFEKSIIDRQTKNDTRKTKGYEGADIMLDFVLMKLEDNPMLFETVLTVMKEVDLLENIAAELESMAASGVQRVVSTDGAGASSRPPKVSSGIKEAPSKVLKNNMTSLLDAISDPDKLATDLYNADLISRSVQDEVHTTSGLSRYSKASKIVNDFQRQLNVFDEQDSLVKFCGVLKAQGDPILLRKGKEILYQL